MGESLQQENPIVATSCPWVSEDDAAPAVTEFAAVTSMFFKIVDSVKIAYAFFLFLNNKFQGVCYHFAITSNLRQTSKIFGNFGNVRMTFGQRSVDLQ